MVKPFLWIGRCYRTLLCDTFKSMVVDLWFQKIVRFVAKTQMYWFRFITHTENRDRKSKSKFYFMIPTAVCWKQKKYMEKPKYREIEKLKIKQVNALHLIYHNNELYIFFSSFLNITCHWNCFESPTIQKS